MPSVRPARHRRRRPRGRWHRGSPPRRRGDQRPGRSAATEATLALLARSDPADLSLSVPATLAQVHDDVLGDLAAHNRGLITLVLAAGALLVGVVAFADVLVRRTDLGRRRALGAPRWALVAMLVTRSALGGIAGAILGTAVTVAAIARSGQQPDLVFAAATAVLALLATTCATLLPATYAAHQDPVRVLRTP